MAVGFPFFMALILGGAVGSSHTQFIESGKNFQQRMQTYATIGGVGLVLLFLSSFSCYSDECNRHSALPVVVLLTAAFSTGLGGTGMVVNFSSRGTARDPDVQMAAASVESDGIALSSSTTSSSYQPVAIQESNLL